MSDLEERKSAGLELINTMLRDLDYTPLQALLDQAQGDTKALLDLLLCNDSARGRGVVQHPGPGV